MSASSIAKHAKSKGQITSAKDFNRQSGRSNLESDKTAISTFYDFDDHAKILNAYENLYNGELVFSPTDAVLRWRLRDIVRCGKVYALRLIGQANRVFQRSTAQDAEDHLNQHRVLERVSQFDFDLPDDVIVSARKPWSEDRFRKMSHLDPWNPDHLRCELVNTEKSIDNIRLRCMMDWRFDPDPDQSFSTSCLMYGETSDSCSTEDDGDDDWRYFVIRSALRLFLRDDTRRYLVTEPISERRLRKDVRAWARLARYRCIKLPDSKMLLHKDRTYLPRRPRKKKAFLPVPLPPGDPGKRTYLYGEYTPKPISLGNNENQNESMEHIWQPRGDKAGYSSGGSNGSSASLYSTTSRRKKQRLPRSQGAYHCTFSGCHKVFNRDCDRRHHERNHQSKDTLPYACGRPTSDKRFAFPKDLRRHARTHLPYGASSDDMG